MIPQIYKNSSMTMEVGDVFLCINQEDVNSKKLYRVTNAINIAFSKEWSNIPFESDTDKILWINQGHMRIYFGKLAFKEIKLKYPEELI